MKILFINAYYRYGSTGCIVETLANYCKLQGHTVKVLYGFFDYDDDIATRIQHSKGLLPFYTELMKTRITGFFGFNHSHRTDKICKMIDDFQPDIVNLHNIHGGYLNCSILLNYLKEKNIKTFVTLHDCWLMTGHCAHFTSSNYFCEKWKTKCEKCEYCKLTKYPKTYFFDRSKKQFELKKEAFLNFDSCKIISPCKWMDCNVSLSPILNKLQHFCIYNGIDFYRYERQKNDKNNKILLGVSGTWSLDKGIELFGKLSNEIDDNFKVVLIGKADNSFKAKYSKIQFIEYVNSKQEMANYYDASFCLINFSLADNFPTINIESLQRGLPVISFRTGGSVELENSYFFQLANDFDSVIQCIRYLDSLGSRINKNDIIEYGKKFSSEEMCRMYLKEFLS